MSSPTTTLRSYWKHPVLVWAGSLLAALLTALYIGSFFFDGIVLTHTRSAMNERLKGYHVSLEHAHLQLVGGRLTLRNLVIIQLAHPRPAVLDIPIMRFHIEWKELLNRRVVAEVILSHPKVHIDRTQFAAEKNSKVPLKKEGWQDALEAAYPLKINRFTIDGGDVVYIQDSASPPLHLAQLNFTSDNIRNIRAPSNVYPSKMHATMAIFSAGRATIDGHADFLEEPFPGVRARFAVENVPLSALGPELRQINLGMRGGRFSASGLAEYSPKVTRVEVDNATIGGVDIDYVHLPATRQAEAQRVKAAGREIEQQNNRPAVDIKVGELAIVHSNLTYTDQTASPSYRLFINDATLVLRNLSNHREQGPARISLTGKFMGSGDAKLTGEFLAAASGPALDANVAVEHTDLPSLNGLFRAWGRFDVAAGQFSVFSAVAIKNGDVSGYVKPLFTNVEIYSYRKDIQTGVLHQAKELLIGGVSHVLTNWSSGNVATEVDLTGKLDSPQISTWQAIEEVLRNAFVEAILPGFDRSVGMNPGASDGQERQRK